MSMKPDIVLVQKSVSRIAQELFNKVGITLVLNVKASVLERVARCTGAEILTSVDAHMGKPVLGTCQQFYVENFGNKALMFFEGCPIPERGCSVLLRGSTNKKLKILKAILRQLVLMLYNWKLEKSYMMDQFASPQVKNKPLNNDSTIKGDSSVLPNDNNNRSELTERNNTEPLSTNTELENKFQYFLNATILSLSPVVDVCKQNIIVTNLILSFVIFLVFSAILGIRKWKTLQVKKIFFKTHLYFTTIE